MRKDELRRQMRQHKRQFTRQQLEELSLPIVARLRQRLKEAQTIVAYYPLPDEVDIRPLLDEWLADGRTVFLPKVTGEETMELRRYTGADDLQEGAFHILEPIENQGENQWDSENQWDRNLERGGREGLILIPGMAFDAQGHRLGRGRGYYDRFLSSLRTISIKFIGVCFDFQKVPEVPFDEHDIPVDEVI